LEKPSEGLPQAINLTTYNKRISLKNNAQNNEHTQNKIIGIRFLNP